MELILFIGLTAWIAWLLYRVDLFKHLSDAYQEQSEMALNQVRESEQGRTEAVQKLDEMQRFLASLANRPIYAALTSDQIEIIGKMILAGTGKKEYLN